MTMAIGLARWGHVSAMWSQGTMKPAAKVLQEACEAEALARI